MATATKSPRGRASKPVMDYSKLEAVEEAEPLKIQRQREANPFLDKVKESVERDQAFSFAGLVNETAAKQVASLLSRAAEQLEYGMSVRIEKTGKTYKVAWQAKPERIKRPRKAKASDNGESGDE